MRKKKEQPKLYAVAGKCCIPTPGKAECPMTLVYPIGADQHVCWLHILVNFPELLPLVVPPVGVSVKMK